ncbi:putative DNA polymerase epsilon catalytic subunit A [Hibiscus syriacus]|uniref:pectinesterase n=1 Tax=Hibiscus syriacus TaxID=106335 RepID=A0A6A2YRT3_HIBSY|nr:putative DNA polymerase epsilon catalytic subunit A [Hibiscus syriacus]
MTPFITLSGSKANSTILNSSDSGNIITSATVTVMASDFVGRYLTIQNTFRKNGVQAAALRVSSDRVAFFGCRILGYQDTLLYESGRHYYYNCYIEGSVDFICGNAASLFEISNVILPRGWDDWGDASKQSTVFYDEYKCYGPGADRSQRVEWSQKLAAKVAELFLSKSIVEAKNWIKPTPKHFKKVFPSISNNSTPHP